VNIESSLTFFVAIFIFSITPGPGVFALLGSAIQKGVKESFPLALGMTVSDIVYLVLACYGLSTIATNYALAFKIIQILGAFYLFYLAYKMFTAPINLDVNNQEIEKKDFFMGFIQGFLISASNPKVILFYIAFLPTFINLDTLSHQDVFLAVFIAFFALIGGLMSIPIMANKAKLMLKSNQAMKKLNTTAASIMFGAGVYLLVKE
jgi:threonine/homoserine/homoserine lactone efflux protein